MRRLLFALLIPLAACTEPATTKPELTRAQVSSAGTPLLIAELTERRAYATLIPAGQNGPVRTWRTADGVTLSYDNGVLAATSGLGHDLMAAETQPTHLGLAGRQGSSYHVRRRYLDGENRTRFQTFDCTMAPGEPEALTIAGTTIAARSFTEACHRNRLTIRNTYWLAGGTVRKSSNWIGPDAGHVVTELALP